MAACEAQRSTTCSSSSSGRARTTGSAWIGFADERRKVTSAGIARRQLDAAVAHRDRVDDVARLDDRPARDLDDDRVHGARA